jgi:hypothetical protein
MARPYTVQLPGGGSITVNASSPEAARENAGVGAGASVVAGGHQAHQDNGTSVMNSGSENYEHPEGYGDVYNTGTTGAGGVATTNDPNAKPKTKASADGSTPDPGTIFGMTGGANGTTEADRTKSIYEGRQGEALDDWMKRVFRQGTRDFGGTLSPDADNPYGRTPYANWFQNRYADVVPANIVLGKLLNNTGNGEDFAKTMEGGMQSFMGEGVGRGFGTGTEGASQNLGKLNSLLNGFGNNATEGLSPDQVAMLGSLNDSPAQQLAMFNAQISGGMGANPFAANYVNSLAQRLQSDYYDDIVGNDPAKQGTFLQNLMQRLNMTGAR